MQELSIKELSEDVRAAINHLKQDPEIENVGIVTKISDGIAWYMDLVSVV